jgi:hypothetical protein
VPRVIWVAATLAALVVAAGLAPAVLIAPKNPADPRQVFVIDHGTHSSLALTTAEGSLVRYAYGDLRYYAGRDTSLASGAAALLLPTPATLGRAELAGPATPENLRNQLVVVVEEVYELTVEGLAVDQLIARLDEMHNQGSSDHISVSAYGFVFAPHPDDYFWANNSSTMIASWLGELGVDVYGWPVTATWWVGD